MYAYYHALEKPFGRNSTARAYEIWRSNNKDIRTYIGANKLANVRRDIIKNKRLTDIEIHNIKEEVRRKIAIQTKENTAEVPSMNRDLPSTTATGNTVRQIIEDEDTAVKEANDVETEQITVEEMSQEMSENPDSITPNFQTNDVEIMRQNILRELGIVQNIEMNKREILHKIQSNKNTKLKIKTGNSALKEILKEILKVREPNLNEVNNLIYATAKVVTEECTGSKKRKDNKRRKPIWKEKIEKEIEQMRGDLSIISELQRGIDVKGRKCRRMIKIHQLTKENITSVKETIKQKMQLKAQRIRRYERRSKFYRQNMIFKTDARKFYREVGKEKVAVKDIPPIEKVEEFWKGIWSNDRPFNVNAEWIKTIEQGKEHIEEKQWIDISTEEVEMALKNHINGSQQE